MVLKITLPAHNLQFFNIQNIKWLKGSGRRYLLPITGCSGQNRLKQKKRKAENSSSVPVK